MKPEDRKAFLEVIIGFAELKGKQLSAPALEIYWRAMQGWTLEEFRAAAEELLRRCEFMPTPKDFEDLRNAGRLTPGEAWARALSLVRTGNYRGDYDLAPEIERAVHAIGGWRVIAQSSDEGLAFLERRFAEHYEAIREAEDTREAVPLLSGPSPFRALAAAKRLA